LSRIYNFKPDIRKQMPLTTPLSFLAIRKQFRSPIKRHSVSTGVLSWDVKLTSHLHPKPRLKKQWSSTSNPPIRFH